MTISIVGFSSTFKVPGYWAETVYHAGPITAGDIPLTLLLVGTKLSTGSATADSDVKDIFSEDDADTYFGAGGELARMCYAALRTPGVRIKAAAVAEAGGSAAGTATVTITGTWTTSGTWQGWIDGDYYSVSIASTDVDTDVADNIAATVNANPHASVTATVGSAPDDNEVTFTRKSKGARGNNGVVFQDTSLCPSGLSSALAGGTSVTGGGVHFTGGSGVENVSTLLGVLYPGTYDRIAVAQIDSTNLGKWETQVNQKAGVLEGRLEHVVAATNGSLSSATSLATSTLNAPRVQLLWHLNSETFPPEIAAAFAAVRTATEQNNPSADYDGVAIPGVVGQREQADWPSVATQTSALDNGVTPVTTTPDGTATIVRSITTYCLNGSNPDYRTLDTYQAVVPDYVRKDIGLF